MKLTTTFFIIAALFILSACGSLKHEVSQIKPGASKTDVLNVLGSPDDDVADDGLELWQYYVIAAVGFCEYQQIWFWDERVLKTSNYTGPSIFGCKIGMKNADWEGTRSNIPKDELDKIKAKSTDKKVNTELIEELVKLDELYKSGALTESEYKKAKGKILD